MSYDQAMKHWGNHRKDRFFQQCSPSVFVIESYRIPKDKFKKCSNDSIQKIIDSSPSFPLNIYQNGIGIWEIVPSNHLFGTIIETMEGLIEFARDYA